MLCTEVVRVYLLAAPRDSVELSKNGKTFCVPVVAVSSEVYCGIQPQMYHFKRITSISAVSHIKRDALLSKIREGHCALTLHQTICLKNDLIGNSVV